MTHSRRCLLCLLFPVGLALAVLSFSGATPGRWQSGADAARQDTEATKPGVEQLRHVNGRWKVRTEFLAEDGSVTGSADGEYRFRWVVEDRVLSGESELPALGQKSAILFYVKQEQQQIEMCSVGADGQLWVMTGPLDSEVRTTAPKIQPDGSSLQLRFTRSAVSPDRFESRMELSTDGGQTWKPGNHQVFERHE